MVAGWWPKWQCDDKGDKVAIRVAGARKGGTVGYNNGGGLGGLGGGGLVERVGEKRRHRSRRVHAK